MDWMLELVPVPVTDVDRAKQFYADQVGFVVDHDSAIDDLRVVQLTPPGSACSIALGAPTGAPPGTAQGLQLVVADIDGARAELSGRGVVVGEVEHYEGATLVPGRGGPWNSFASFSDPDGNGWVLQERPVRR